MANVIVYFVLLVQFCFVSHTVSHRWERSQRPSFAGSTGGTWENYVGQIIPPGTPWPAKPVDYPTTSKTTPQIKGDNQLYPTSTPEIETLTSTIVVPAKEVDSNSSLLETNSSKQALNSSDSSSASVVLEYKPIRPSFAGSTGGTWESYVGQKVPSGTPQPGKDQKTSSAPIEDEVTTEQPGTTTTRSNTSRPDVQPSIVLEHKPSRPSFAGTVGGSSFSVPTSTDSSSLSSTSSSVVLGSKPDRPSFAGSIGGSNLSVPSSTSTEKPSDSSSLSSTSSPVVLGNKPDRPSFAGSSGGTWESYVGQKVPSGTPWPQKADPTDTTTRSTTTSTTTTLVLEQEPEKDEDDLHPDNSTLITFPTDDEDTRPSFVLGNKPNRPSFAGNSSGTWENLVGQVVPTNRTNATTSISESKEVNPTTGTTPKQVKPYVYIALDRDDIKNAISKNSVVKLTEIEAKLDTLKSESVNVPEDAIKATDKFLMAERCNNENSLKKNSDPIIHIFLNVEGLAEAVKHGVADNLKSND